MPTLISQNVALPPYPNILLEWAHRSHRAAERLKNTLDFVQWFCNRSQHDCRIVREDPETYERKPVDGEFYDSPCYRILSLGTAEERQKGFCYDNATTEDGSQYTNIRTYTKSIPLDVVYTDHRDVLEGHHITSHPHELAYQAMVLGMGLQPCSRIFILKGTQGPEQAMYCFPLVWGAQKDLYLLVTIDSRYGDRAQCLFQGDVAAYAATRKRGPRMAEVGDFLKNKDQWPLHEVPLVPMFTNGEWLHPQSVTLRDLGAATQVLLTQGYLYSGGA